MILELASAKASAKMRCEFELRFRRKDPVSQGHVDGGVRGKQCEAGAFRYLADMCIYVFYVLFM